MKGETLKIILLKNGIKQSEVARLIGDSQQKFNAALNSDDVKSSLIEKIAAALGMPIGQLYGESVATTVTGSTAIVGNGNKGNSLNANESRLLSLLEEKDRQIARLLDLLQAAGGEKR